MVQSIYNGYSGVKSYQVGVDTISNNIANINTNGYRANEIKFESIFSESMDSLNANSPDSNSKGFGVTVSSNRYSTKMGSIVNAEGSDFNMALTNDRGYFKVGSSDGTFYTRDGAFSLDARGNVVNSSGQFLYGVNLGKVTSSTTAGVTSSTITPSSQDYTALKSATVEEPVVIPANLKYPPQATSYVNSAVNLDIDSSIKDSSIIAGYETSNLSSIYGNNKKLISTASDQITFNVTTAGATTPTSIQVGNLNTLQDLATALSAVIPTTVSNGKLVFDNSAGASDVQFDYSASSQNVLDALGITSSKTVPLGAKDSSSMLQIPSVTFENKVYDAQGNQSLLKNTYVLDSKSGTNETWKLTSQVGTNAESIGYLSFDGSDPTIAPKLYSDRAKTAQLTELTVATDLGNITYNPTSFTDEFGDKYNSTNVYSFTEEYRKTTDGKTDGVLDSVTITDDGFININFTNGASELYGRVAVSTFTNEQGLEKVGGNLFRATANSGAELNGWNDSVVGVAQHKLETSNVHMEDALTSLIIMQRSYSANTKTITASDEMIKEAISLKK